MEASVPSLVERVLEVQPVRDGLPVGGGQRPRVVEDLGDLEVRHVVPAGAGRTEAADGESLLGAVAGVATADELPVSPETRGAAADRAGPGLEARERIGDAAEVEVRV